MKHKKQPKPRKRKTTAPLKISPGKKRLFYLAAALIPLFFFGLLEVGLQLLGYSGDTALFVSIPTEDSPYYGINQNIGRRYFFMQSTLPIPRKDLFLKEKPEKVYRIFVLGGSTTAGFPYGNNLMFTRILQRRLADTFPDRGIEVVNTAMTAINSYTLLDFMDEILDQQPDALLIYAGHNEFYGALGAASVESLGEIRWFVKTYLKLQRYKTFILLRDAIGQARKWIAGKAAGGMKDDPSATMMARIVKDQTIPLGNPLYATGKQQFSENLRDIIRKATEAGIPLLISELVSNTRDHQPFVSVRYDTLPPAEKVFKTAQSEEKNGAYEQARNSYYRAKDLDALRFRATEEFNDIIHSVASEFDIPVVPMKSYFENASPHRLIGNNLMHEHLHPNIEGYFLMAEAFYNTMHQEGFISSHWEEQYMKPTGHYRRNWGYTGLDSTLAALRVLQLKGGWPFKKTPGPNMALYRYKPQTKTDSIALNVLTSGSMTLEQGHMELAKYYKSRGEPERAFDEYNALIYTVPSEDLFFENAARILIKTKQYNRALPILYGALEYNPGNAFAYKWIGQIYLIQNRMQQGITYLEKARALKPTDDQLLFNLSRAYFETAQPQKANEVLNQLKRTSPSSPFISHLERYNASPKKPADVSAYLAKAQQHLRAKQYNQAYVVLRQSLQIQETALANKLIGAILLVNDKNKEALPYLERAREMEDVDDPRLLYNLSSAYFADSQYQKARETFIRLKEISPDFADPGDLENKIQQTLQK